MSSVFCSKSCQCKNKDWCASDYNPEPDDYECFEPMTNADRIRNMTDEELAFYIFNHPQWVDLDGYLDWLKQEVSDED